MGIYSNLEEKWYAAIDKIDTVLPVYGLVDKIDKFIPSFLLFLIVIIFLIISGIFFFTGFNFDLGGDYTATLNFQTAAGVPLDGTLINFSIIENGETLQDLTHRTDNDGKIVLEGLKWNQEVRMTSETQRGKLDKSIFIDRRNLAEVIKLEQYTPPVQPITRTILLKDELGLNVREAVDVTFYCENSTIIPTPRTATFENGVLEVTEPLNCVKLYARITSNNFKQDTYTIDSNPYNLRLKAYEAPATQLTVKVRYNELPVGGSNFRITLSGSENYSEVTGSSSEVVLNVVPGNYTLSVSDPNGDYGTVTRTITISGEKTEIVPISKNIKTRITVIVKNQSNNAIIPQANVTLVNSQGRVVEERLTDSNGRVLFSLTDTGNYKVTAKKVGDMNGGFFAKSMDITNAVGDINAELKLEAITMANAGRVKVRVVDQDGEAVTRAKIMLKYVTNEEIVELNEQNNFAITDINGYATFLAGRVEGSVFAYAIKYPFTGESAGKSISLEQENEFTITLDIGYSQININVVDEKGDNVNAEARLYTILDEEASGLISIENGKGSTTIKAGKVIYLAVRAEGYETYFSESMMLWPQTTYNFEVEIYSEINEPKINQIGIFNSVGKEVRTLQSGNNYYALFRIDSDQEQDVGMHFRMGKEKLLENDFLEIDTIDTSGQIFSLKGTSYSPEDGYSYDSENTTDSLAKWVNIEWDNFGKGTRIVKINFRVKPNTPPNEELQFFWRAWFDDIKKPLSNATNNLYDETYFSDIYYAGTESSCEEDFCVINEWLYSKSEDLYINPPFVVQQVKEYTYHYQLINNSTTDYGSTKKKIALSLKNLSEENKGVKIKSYEIKSGAQVVSGNGISSIVDLEILEFEKNAAIDVKLELEGNSTGTSDILSSLKADGAIIFTDTESFNVPENKQLTITIDPTTIPSLINTQIEIGVTDNSGEPINDARIRVYSKDPGFSEMLVDESFTTRIGKTIVNSGAQFIGGKIIIEISKEGFSRKRLQLIVTEDVTEISPTSLSFAMNVITNRDVTQELSFGNKLDKKLFIVGINPVIDFEGMINRSAMNAYLNELIGTELGREEVTKLNFMRLQISGEIAEANFIEPVNISGTVVVTLRVEGTEVIYDKLIPVNVSIKADASTEAKCLHISNAVQEKTTERGKVTFIFELQNACTDKDAGQDIAVESLSVTGSNDFEGMAEVSLQSTSTTNGGRSAIDGATRQVFNNLKAGEKLIGQVTYSPSANEAGSKSNINLTIQGKAYGQTIATNPTTLNFKVNVLNLRECITINSTSGAVANDDEATITVDSTKCLGQKVEVYLCRGDTGCSGCSARDEQGNCTAQPEGKITLSSRDFTLQNESKTISAYSPTLPGSYGVTVWARVQGNLSYSYIGEAGVSFRENETDLFELSKYEVYLVGGGSEDVILLQNNLLTQNVKVKANECIWGLEEPETNWGSVIAGASIGATLGNMVGGAFASKSSESGKDDSTTADEKISELEAKNTAGTLTNSEKKTLNTLTQNRDTLNTAANNLPDGQSTNIFRRNDGTLSYSTERTVSGGDYIGTISNNNGSYQWSGMGTNVNSNNSAGLANTVNSNINNTSGSFWGRVSNMTFDATHQNAPSTGARQPVVPSTSGDTLTPQNSSPGGGIPQSNIDSPTRHRIEGYNELPKVSFSALYFPGEITNNTTIDSAQPKLNFGYAQGTMTIIGAIAGALAAYYAQDYSCNDHYQTASYEDFVIFLQGQELSVTTPDGETQEIRKIPSDAGALNFNVPGIKAAWDFSDASYGTVENAGLKFYNDGSTNDAKSLYGTLTVNATKHNHGFIPVKNGDSSDKDYDVLCKEDTFGQYWIGSDEKSGECSGVTTSNYSQKYHIRIISGEPSDEQAYIDKADSCYNGVLTGSTGSNALPRIKLEWDWDSIETDTCDYGNPNYVYCDAVQFTISLTKKMAALKDFFELNSTMSCPSDPLIREINDSLDVGNSIEYQVAGGYVGISDIDISVNDNDTATATITITNNTGATADTYISYSWKGSGASVNGQENLTGLSVGESVITYTANTPKWDDLYFFTATINGPGGNRQAVTRTFENRPLNPDCWAPRTTRSVGGVPSIIYYFANDEYTIQWTSDIPNVSSLYSHLNFGAYLIKDAYPKNFFNDFKSFYEKQFTSSINASEREILDYLASEDFKIIKRFSNSNEINAGLYDVWIYSDFLNDFSLRKGNASTDVSLLMMKEPIIDSPFYRIPFDGDVGKEFGRNGYGTKYSNNGNDLLINNSSRLLVTPSTFEKVTSNGVVNVSTDDTTSFEMVNSSVGTRGQLASVTANQGTASLKFTPNFATPIIAKYDLKGTSGTLKFEVQKNYQGVQSGGNLTYWTGAAKSRDFGGQYAIDVYKDSADGLIETPNTYGFNWSDTIYSGTIFLKTVLYTPINSSYALVSQNDGLFWTPNSEFSNTVQLQGIGGMQKNNQLGNSKFETLKDLFDLVETGDVCISNDGSTSSFWWNPRILEVTPGNINSLYNKEVGLAGSN